MNLVLRLFTENASKQFAFASLLSSIHAKNGFGVLWIALLSSFSVPSFGLGSVGFALQVSR